MASSRAALHSLPPLSPPCRPRPHRRRRPRPRPPRPTTSGKRTCSARPSGICTPLGCTASHCWSRSETGRVPPRPPPSPWQPAPSSATELRHPERAAAWLRRQVLKELPRIPASRHLTPTERHLALVEIGGAQPAIAALEELTPERRAALVAASWSASRLPTSPPSSTPTWSAPSGRWRGPPPVPGCRRSLDGRAAERCRRWRSAGRSHQPVGGANRRPAAGRGLTCARKKQSTNDLHQRFTEWLEGIGAEDPPRDLAVHAAVCVDCQELIAAVDALTSIDTALAGIPQARSVPAVGWLRMPGRAAVAAGGLAALVVVGVASWQLIQTSGVAFVLPVESPTQEVLGDTGTPRPTPSPTTLASAQPASDDPTPPEQAPTSPAHVHRPAIRLPTADLRPPSASAGPADGTPHRPSQRPPHGHAARGTDTSADASADTGPTTPSPTPPPTPEPTPGGGPLAECIDTAR